MSIPHESELPELDPMTVDPANLGSVDPLSVEGLFLVALSKTGMERNDFLSAQCADSAQRLRVEALLVAYEQAGDFLQKPAVSSEPTPIGQYLAPCELPGTLGKLGPYEILEEIGRGGMGVVFRAHDPKLQRIVAVKALAPELARLPSARQRFLREARAAAAISHPHVVTIFAVEGTEEASLGTERTTLPFLVMECIVGQTLQDKIKRVGALKVEEIVRISRQVAEGLTAAHKRGLIHRDIKPANILLENGVERVKITDFGLARTTSDGGITHTGEILGTPQCMSPEQARGEIVDQRSDLFSLGCVMYTMCTGVSPFRADNMLAVMKKVCETTPRPIAELNSQIPEWLWQLVHQLLKKQAELRVQTAGEVVEVLESRAMVGNHAHPVAPATHEVMSSLRSSKGHADRLLDFARWQHWLPTVMLASVIFGFAIGQNRYTFMIWLPVWTVLAWAGLSWAKLGWSWINWKSSLASVIGLFVGANLRVWMIVGYPRSGVAMDIENYLRGNAGLFVFPLAIAIFWLLTRLMPWAFIQTRPQAATGAPLATAQPRSPWSVLAWMFVGLLGLGMLSTLGFAVALIVPWLAKISAPQATVVIRCPAGEIVQSVSIDGREVTMSPSGPNEWTLRTQPGEHSVFVKYDSDDRLYQEGYYVTSIYASVEHVNTVNAQPIVRSTRPDNTAADQVRWRSAIVDIVVYGKSDAIGGDGERILGHGVVVSQDGLILTHLAGGWASQLNDWKILAKFDDGSQVHLSVAEDVGSGMVALQPKEGIQLNHVFPLSTDSYSVGDEVYVGQKEGLAFGKSKVILTDRKITTGPSPVWQLEKQGQPDVLAGQPVLSSSGELIGLTLQGTGELLLAVPVGLLKELFPKSLSSEPPKPVAATSVPASEPELPNTAEKCLAKLQGDWSYTGKAIDKDAPEGLQTEVHIEGDLMTFKLTHPDGRQVELTHQLRLVLAGPPQQIDVIFDPNGGDERSVMKGIIEINEDVVRICLHNSSDSQRPEVFAASESSNVEIWELERKSAAAAKP